MCCSFRKRNSMSRFLKIILLSSYSALFVQFIMSLLIDRNVEIVDIEYVLERKSLAKIGQDLLKHKRLASLMNVDYKKLERLPTDYKYVLRWAPSFSPYNVPSFVNGQRSFLDHNCSFINCYITNDKALLNDFRHYDAILFDVENTWDIHPVLRSPYQRYIFFSAGSSATYRSCGSYADNYYNLTWTYKLDSDIRWSYITILDVNGTFVGPKADMHWIESMSPTPDKVRRIIQGKNKTAAWFVSNCQSESNRQNVADKIKDALKKYGLELDVYGWCGKLRCPKDQFKDCLELVEKQYHFYFAFEYSFAEDYVTEKILHALDHHTVPVVYGGANYSWFLPPGSYLDARALDAQTVAHKMFEAVSNPDVYVNYFRWHNHYKYKQTPETADVCKLCQILNSPMKFTAKKNFRKWWNKDYAKYCKLNNITDRMTKL